MSMDMIDWTLNVFDLLIFLTIIISAWVRTYIMKGDFSKVTEKIEKANIIKIDDKDLYSSQVENALLNATLGMRGVLKGLDELEDSIRNIKTDNEDFVGGVAERLSQIKQVLARLKYESGDKMGFNRDHFNVFYDAMLGRIVQIQIDFLRREGLYIRLL